MPYPDMVKDLLVSSGGQVISASSFAAADTVESDMRNYPTTYEGADEAILDEKESVSARTQDIYQNNTNIAPALRKQLYNTIGAGLNVQFKPEYALLGQDKAWAYDWGRTARAAFNNWGNDLNKFCDTRRKHNFPGLCWLAYLSLWLRGDILAVVEWLPKRGSRYATAISVIDPARLCNPQGKPDTKRLKGGMEFDQYGAVKAYWIRESIPTLGMFDMGSYKWKRVKAYTRHGRRQVIYYHDPRYLEQSRGITDLTPAIKTALKLDKYKDVTLDSATLATIFSAVIESDAPGSQIANALGGVGTKDMTENYLQNAASFAQNAPMKVNGRRVHRLYPNESLKFNKAENPSSEYDAFISSHERDLANNFDLTYEQLSGFYGDTNYSGARSGNLETRKGIITRRRFFAQGFCAPVAALFLEEAVAKGDIELPEGAPNFYEAFNAYARTTWIGPPVGNIDPKKEAEAEEIELVLGGLSYENYCAARGLDMDEQLAQLAFEKKLQEDLGLTLRRDSGVQNEQEEPEAASKDEE